MKFNKKIIILIGNIGSGKSTITKVITKQGYVVIARDAFRYMIGGGTYVFNTELEPAIFASEEHVIEEFMRLGINIIIDETGINKKYRKKYLRKAKNHKYNIIAYVLPRLSMKESVDRRMNNPHGQNDRKLWETVWKKFDSQYEDPVYEEGFNSIVHLKEKKNGIQKRVRKNRRTSKKSANGKGKTGRKTKTARKRQK